MKIKRVGFLFAIILAVSIITPDTVYSQAFVPTEVNISDKKVNVDGQEYYVHTVLQGHTLYSISKKYQVPVDTIIKLNPAVRDGLKSGSVLMIPVAKVVEQAIQQAEQEKAQRAPLSKEELKKYKKHSVKWYESIDDIAAKYDVTVESIVDLNRLENTILKKRQTIYIPDKEYIKQMTVSIPSYQKHSLSESMISNKKRDQSSRESFTFRDFSVTEEEQQQQQHHITQKDLETIYSGYDPTRSYKVSMILPVNSQNADKIQNNYLDFYSGTLLAIDQLKSLKHVKVNLNLIDQYDYPSIEDLCNSGILDDSELIIGPVFRNDIEKMLPYINRTGIPLVSPMDHKSDTLLYRSPFLFQVPSNSSTQHNRIFNRFLSELDTANVVILYEKGTEGSTPVAPLLAEMDDNNMIYKSLEYGIHEGREIFPRYNRIIEKGENAVFIASESEAFVSDALRNLNVLNSTDSLNIRVYTHQKVRASDVIDITYFHNMNVRFSVPYYIDYNNYRVRQFVDNYIEIFKTDPSPFAFQGYDITTYFLNMLDKYGRKFPVMGVGSRMNLLQSNMTFFRRCSTCGFENLSTKDIQYMPNWSIKVE